TPTAGCGTRRGTSSSSAGRARPGTARARDDPGRAAAAGPRRGPRPAARGALEVGVRRLPRVHPVAARRPRALAAGGARRHRRLLHRAGRPAVLLVLVLAVAV